MPVVIWLDDDRLGYEVVLRKHGCSAYYVEFPDVLIAWLHGTPPPDDLSMPPSPSHVDAYLLDVSGFADTVWPTSQGDVDIADGFQLAIKIRERFPDCFIGMLTASPRNEHRDHFPVYAKGYNAEDWIGIFRKDLREWMERAEGSHREVVRLASEFPRHTLVVGEPIGHRDELGRQLAGHQVEPVVAVNLTDSELSSRLDAGDEALLLLGVEDLLPGAAGVLRRHISKDTATPPRVVATADESWARNCGWMPLWGWVVPVGGPAEDADRVVEMVRTVLKAHEPSLELSEDGVLYLRKLVSKPRQEFLGGPGRTGNGMHGVKAIALRAAVLAVAAGRSVVSQMDLEDARDMGCLDQFPVLSNQDSLHAMRVETYRPLVRPPGGLDAAFKPAWEIRERADQAIRAVLEVLRTRANSGIGTEPLSLLGEDPERSWQYVVVNSLVALRVKPSVVEELHPPLKPARTGGRCRGHGTDIFVYAVFEPPEKLGDRADCRSKLTPLIEQLRQYGWTTGDPSKPATALLTAEPPQDKST